MELAGAGAVRDLIELEKALVTEGYEDVQAHFSGATTRAHYRQIIRQSRIRVTG